MKDMSCNTIATVDGIRMWDNIACSVSMFPQRGNPAYIGINVPHERDGFAAMKQWMKVNLIERQQKHFISQSHSLTTLSMKKERSTSSGLS